MHLNKLIDGLGAKRKGSSWMAPCPAHHDPNPSLAIRGENGSVLVHCHAGCPQDAVITALKDKGLWEEAGVEESSSDVFEADYTYRDATGKTVGIKSRYRTGTGKRFTWRVADHENCKGLREHDLLVKDMPLYGSEFLAKAKDQAFALLVEGEKAAHACWRANLIAFCNPGGSGQKDFGDSLDILKGMDVVLWPDNDEPGRSLMRAIKDKLSGLAQSVRMVAPELGEKGDAHDWLTIEGHTRQDFLGLLDKLQDKPWAEKTANGYLVSVPESGGLVRFEFADIERYRTLHHEATLSVWLEISGFNQERFQARLNMVSLSSREAFRRQVEDVLPLGKGVWSSLINKALQIVHKAREDSDPSIPLCQVVIPTTQARYLLRPWLPDGAPAILFGQGSSGKGYLSVAAAVSLVSGAPFLDIEPTRRCRVLYVDYEDTAEVLAARVRLVGAGIGIGDEPMEDIIYWPAQEPLTDSIPALEKLIAKGRIGFIIIDSSIAACAGPPKEPEVVSAYFNGLRRLGIPSLSISHITKDEEGDNFPFGSIFWHNRARITWNMKKQQEEGDSILHLGLFNRKPFSNDRKQPSLGLRIEFEPDAVTIRREDVLTNFAKEMGPKAQVLSCLRLARCNSCVSEDSGLSPSSVSNTLETLRRAGQVTPTRDQCPDHGLTKWARMERG